MNRSTPQVARMMMSSVSKTPDQQLRQAVHRCDWRVSHSVRAQGLHIGHGFRSISVRSVMNRLSLLGPFIAAAALATGAEGTKPPRNIVLFVADDHGLDAGCYGNPVLKTPAMDQLAREGTRFRNAFCTTASCSASRSVILTGLQNHATGHYGHSHAAHHFSTYSSAKSLPVILNERGYRTGRIGKYHVAPEPVYHFQTVLPASKGARHSVQMADDCRDFIADRSKPFFLYFCVVDPHRSGGVMKGHPLRPNPFGCDVEYPGMINRRYTGQEVVVPPFLPDSAECRAELALYYQAVSRVDEGLGRLVKVLKETGQYDHTLILYTSDNGIPWPAAKTTLYDSGMRLPLIVRSPDQKRRGVVSDAMISWVDFTPTILDAAGVGEVIAPPLMAGETEDGGPPKRAARKAPYKFHGRSFLPVLDQEKPDGWNEVYCSHQFHEITMYYPMRVLRTDRYKLILNIAHPLPYPFASDLHASATWQAALKAGPEGLYGNRRIKDYIQRPRYELYDLTQDPDELRNVAGNPAYKAVFDEMAAKLKAWQKQTRDPWFSKYEYE
jgi:N-sulfoglucosamine sulfohydrolase